MAYPYATLSAVKARLGITDTTDDAMLASLVERGNAKVELYTGRAIGSDGTTQYLFDGYAALESGRVMQISNGIVSISLLEIAPYTGAPFATIPATDYFIHPLPTNRQPNWPGFEVTLTNVPSSGNPYPYFAPGYQNVRITGAFGWTAMPEEVREVAETATVRAFQRRQVGEGDTTGSPDLGESIVFNRWEKSVLDVYRWRPVYIV